MYSIHLLCVIDFSDDTTMVDIAQSVEHLIVVQKVARSNRVIHPTAKPLQQNGCKGFSYMHNGLRDSLCVPYVCHMPHVCPMCARNVKSHGLQKARIGMLPYRAMRMTSDESYTTNLR